MLINPGQGFQHPAIAGHLLVSALSSIGEQPRGKQSQRTPRGIGSSTGKPKRVTRSSPEPRVRARIRPRNKAVGSMRPARLMRATGWSLHPIRAFCRHTNHSSNDRLPPGGTALRCQSDGVDAVTSKRAVSSSLRCDVAGNDRGHRRPRTASPVECGRKAADRWRDA